MARLPRNQVFDENEIGIYHCMNRCVRQAFLMGTDQSTGKSLEHRRAWVQERLEELAAIFAIDHLNFSIMGNHFHVLIRNRPDIRDSWSNEEVIRRWNQLFPKRRTDIGQPEQLTALEFASMLNDPAWVAERRARLGHISWFMRCLAENIANRANAEEDVSSRFWRGRFKMVRILDECGLLACAMYIDLNPVRARLAETPETSFFTSVYERIQTMTSHNSDIVDSRENDQPPSTVNADPPANWLSPVTLARHDEVDTGNKRRASNRGYLEMTFAEYLSLLDWTGRQIRRGKTGSIPVHLAPILERLHINAEAWVTAVANFSRWFRTAVGRAENLAREAARRGRKFLHGTSRSRTVFG